MSLPAWLSRLPPVMAAAESYPPDSLEFAHALSVRLWSQWRSAGLSWRAWLRVKEEARRHNLAERLEFPSFDAYLEALIGQDESTADARFAVAESAGELPARGRPRRGAEKGTDSTLIRGETEPYLLRRLLRDAPTIYAALKAGEYPSARAAAKAAGIIRDPTPLERLQRLWPKCTAAEQAEFLAWIDDRGGVGDELGETVG